MNNDNDKDMKEKENIDLGTFYVSVELQPNGKFDVYLSREGSSGSHYKDMTLEKIGEYVADDIACIAEEYKKR